MASKVCLGLRSRPKASDDLGYLHLAGVLGEKLGEGGDVVAFFARSQQTLGGANLLEQGRIYHLVPKTVRDCVASRQTATENAIYDRRSPTVAKRQCPFGWHDPGGSGAIGLLPTLSGPLARHMNSNRPQRPFPIRHGNTRCTKPQNGCSGIFPALFRMRLIRRDHRGSRAQTDQIEGGPYEGRPGQCVT